MSATRQTVPLSVVCGLLNITPRRVQQLAAEGKIPKAARGKYDLVGAVKGYIGFLQTQSLAGDDVGADAFGKHRARLTAARADITELERDKLAGRQVPVEEVERAWQTVVATMRSRLLTIPSKVAARILAAKNANEAQEIIRREVYDALAELEGVVYEAEDDQDPGEPDPGAAGDQRPAARRPSARTKH